MSSSSWKDPDFAKNLLAFICRDRTFLKKCGGFLSANDFKPSRDETKERWIIAHLGLSFWKKHQSPIGGLLRSEVKEYCEDRQNRISEKLEKKVLALVDFITSGERLVLMEAMEEKVLKYLRTRMRREAVEEIVSLEEKSELTNKKFASISKRVLEWTEKSKLTARDFVSRTSLEDRIVRRQLEVNRTRPLLMIDELDRKTKAIGRGDLGIVLGPLKKGKSLLLSHIAVAYAKQKLKVIYISLEDPIEEVEDRLDASIAYMPIDMLVRMPKRLRRRWKRFSKAIMGRIRLIDGTDEKVTLDDIEEIYLKLRDEGFEADAIFIDYDKYIEAIEKRKNKLEEWDDLYKGFRRFLAKYKLYGWTAAQTQRIGDEVEVITSNKAGDDIGKIQKATMVIGIGQGKQHIDARHLYVTAHKRGRSRFGVNIMMNPARGMAYDRERTWKIIKSGKKKRRRHSEA